MVAEVTVLVLAPIGVWLLYVLARRVYLREQIEGYQRRQRVRPGITGWAQVNQGYDQSVEDVRRKLTYDLEYIRRQSAIEDLRIMVRTIPVILLRRGGW